MAVGLEEPNGIDEPATPERASVFSGGERWDTIEVESQTDDQQ